jgi:hypothetical protein
MDSERYEADSRRTARRLTGTPWALLAILALLIVGGFMLYNSGGHGPARTATSTNTSSAANRPPAPGAPAPTSTAPNQ